MFIPYFCNTVGIYTERKTFVSGRDYIRHMINKIKLN